ncbi:MAG: hypothetical protein QNJ09_01680 [Paracoccaceae bacterium]|nr:hypothetical protein [Paracoccaceae bacterium]
MRNLIFILPVLTLGLAGCAQPLGTVAAGAAIGAAIDDDNRARGAIIGGALGAITAAVIEEYNDGTCLYRNTETGERFRAKCPD